MKLFITGITGYIGSRLAEAAVAKGYKVHALVRQNRVNENSNAITYFTGDVTDYDSVLNAMRGCDYVMHAAAITRLWDKNSSQLYHINVGGTRNILKAAKELGVKRLVFTSSCAVLGPSDQKPLAEEDPRYSAFENDYEVSKYCAEELVKEYSRSGVYSVIVAPPRVYGPGPQGKGNVIGKYIMKVLKQKWVFIPSAKEIKGNYAYIDDVIEGHFLAMHKGLSGEKYILGGENISYEAFYESIKQHASQPINYISVPKWGMKIYSLFVYGLSRITGHHTHISPALIDRLFQNRTITCKKAIRQLGYHVTPFHEGMRLTIHHLKS
ncbi:MAG TPA: NAD-dependent epimerase/dehydratase family protein [Chitinophagaceae bacterium]